jgi:hypothetical protein
LPSVGNDLSASATEGFRQWRVAGAMAIMSLPCQ